MRHRNGLPPSDAKQLTATHSPALRDRRRRYIVGEAPARYPIATRDSSAHHARTRTEHCDAMVMHRNAALHFARASSSMMRYALVAPLTSPRRITDCD